MQSNMSSSLPKDWASLSTSIRTFTESGIKRLSTFSNKFVQSLKQFNLKYEVDDWFSLEGACCLTLIIVIIACILVITLNIYRKIRYSIPASVNCWFCNSNSKVLYSLRHTWTCPKCHQYNGFTTDGNYNKRIPAQFIEALNRPVRGRPANGYQLKNYGSNSNGLCSQCNLNQVLKVFQLSSFVPVNEKNYDAEVEAEQKRLEQLYNICAECRKVVQETLKRTPDERQTLPIKRKTKINKVAPTSTAVVKDCSSNCDDSVRAFLDYQKDVSDTDLSESDSGNSFLSLNNLRIDSQRRHRSFENFNMPTMRSATSSPLSSPRASPPSGYMSASPSFGSISHNRNGITQRLPNEMPSLWKDYPMVRNGMSPSFSVIDTMSCPVGRPAYVAHNSGIVSPSPTQAEFNYQSSHIGSVFGGQKPLLSPPKFSVNNAHFAPYIRYGAYYDIGGAPIMLNPPYYTNPISRSSSQSSGFVSQQGGISSPHQAPTPTSTGFYM